MNLENEAEKNPLSGNLDCFAPIPSEQPNVFKEECPLVWNYLCELGRKTLENDMNAIREYFALGMCLSILYDEKGREGLREAEAQWIKSHFEQLQDQK